MPEALNGELYEEFHQRLEPLIRAQDWSAAEALCRSYLATAERAHDADGAAIFAGFLANSLTALRRPAEALEADELAERYVPTDAYRKILVARRLISELARPEDGLAKLAEAEPLLRDRERGLWLSEKGLALLDAGRAAEAVECFRELTRPECLATMRQFDYFGLVDLRLVSELITKGLAREMCIAYIEAAEAVGARNAAPNDLRTLRDLVARLRDAGA